MRAPWRRPSWVLALRGRQSRDLGEHVCGWHPPPRHLSGARPVQATVTMQLATTLAATDLPLDMRKGGRTCDPLPHLASPRQPCSPGAGGEPPPARGSSPWEKGSSTACKRPREQPCPHAQMVSQLTGQLLVHVGWGKLSSRRCQVYSARRWLTSHLGRGFHPSERYSHTQAAPAVWQVGSDRCGGPWLGSHLR